MSALLSLREYQEILMLDLTKYRNLGLFKHGWYVDMDEPDNFLLYLYLLYLHEEEVLARAEIMKSAYPISNELLHVQVEVTEGDTCFLLQMDLRVCNF